VDEDGRLPLRGQPRERARQKKSYPSSEPAGWDMRLQKPLVKQRKTRANRAARKKLSTEPRQTTREMSDALEGDPLDVKTRIRMLHCH
jgi:hypothetical protein